MKAKSEEIIDRINELCAEHIDEAKHWKQHEEFAGNIDKVSFWKGVEMQAFKIKCALNHEFPKDK